MSMNRNERRAMHKRLMPQIKRIVELEKQIQANVNRDAAEDELSRIIGALGMVEMMAIEDYICSHNLLPSLENK